MNKAKTIMIILTISILLFISLGFTSNCKGEVTLTDTETYFLNLINQARIDNNLNALKVDKYLMSVASTRSNEILKGNFAHRPLHDFIKNTTGTKIMVGEILGRGSVSNIPEDFINAWLNSKTHRDVILNPKYGFTKIGIGITKNKDIQIITILFSSK